MCLVFPSIFLMFRKIDGNERVKFKRNCSARQSEEDQMKKIKRSVPFIIIVLVFGFLLTACAGGTGHVKHRGNENWGAILGYTPQELRAMSPEQYKLAYQKSKAAADANADWARSESQWYKATSQQEKSFAEEIFGTVKDTTSEIMRGTIRDVGNDARYRIRDAARKK